VVPSLKSLIGGQAFQLPYKIVQNRLIIKA
jgi:hypothetical protein